MAAGSGTAFSIALNVTAGATQANGAGTGYNAAPSSPGVTAGVATGTGSAINATPNPSPAGLAAGTGTAMNASTSSTSALAGAATGAGQAFDHALQLRTSPETSMTLTDPVGRVTFTTDTSSFVYDDYPSIGYYWDYAKVGWMKLVLTVPTDIRIDLFNSACPNTYVALLYDADPLDLDVAYSYNTSAGDLYSNWSSIPSDLYPPLSLDAGTYWISASPGNTSYLGTLTVNITAGGSTPYVYYPTSEYGYNAAFDARGVGSSFAGIPAALPATGTGTARDATIRKTVASATGTGSAYGAAGGSPAAKVQAQVAAGTGVAYLAWPVHPAASETFFGDTPPVSGVIYDPNGLTQIITNVSGFTPTDPQAYGPVPTIVTKVQSSSYEYYNIYLQRPAGIQNSDTLLAYITYWTYDGTSTITSFNSRFTLREAARNSAYSHKTEIWSRSALNETDYNYIWQLTGGATTVYYSASLFVIRGAASFTSDQTALFSSVDTYHHPTDPLTAPTGNALLLLGFGSYITLPTTTAYTTTPAMTKQSEVLNSNRTSQGVFSEVATSPGSIGIRTGNYYDPSDTIVWVWLLPAAIGSTGYSGWLELVLPSGGLITIDTFGSTEPDTVLALFADPPPSTPGSGDIAYNDDFGGSFWSQIGPIQLAPGTYWIAAWPYGGDLQANGSITVNVYRLDSPVLAAPPPTGSPVRVILEQLGDIAPIVVWAQTSLETALGGNASMGRIVIRDLGPDTGQFVTGQRVLVDLGPGTRPIYAGYVWRANRRFWFPVDYPDTMHRQWVLTVVDIAVLFRERVVYNQAAPAQIKGPKYLPVTYDNTAVNELTANWLDLTADDIDVSSGVHRVGPITGGEPFTYPWNAGQTWADAMTTIAKLPAAAFGLTPSRVLIYVDVDQRNVPFYLSDEPGPNNVGYREMLILIDGSQLVTEVYAWGAGQGDNKMVLSHRIDAAAVALHGLWQEGISSYAIWKQATIDKVTDSVLNGSPTSHRGHKYDRVEIRAVTHEHGLVIGDRVRFISKIWGYDDVIPVRKMVMTFPTPNEVRYELVLSHEIDEWGFEDPRPPWPGTQVPTVDPVITVTPVPTECITSVFGNLGGGALLSGGSYDQSTPQSGPYGDPSYLADPSNYASGVYWPFHYYTRAWTISITEPLSFPGIDNTHVQDGNAHLNRMTPINISAGSVATVTLSGVDGHGTTPTQVGIMSYGQDVVTNVQNINRPPFQFTNGGTPDAFVFIWSEGVYNPALTGSGSVTRTRTRFGSSLDWWTMVGGTATMSITDDAYGNKLTTSAGTTFSAQAPWNRDTCTGMFRFKVNRASGTPTFDVRFLFGAATLVISPSEVGPTPLVLITGSGATGQNMSEAFIADAWYIVAISLDLPNNATRARIWRETNAGVVTEVSQQANYERVGGSYRPEVGWFVNNPTANPVVLTIDFNSLRTELYEPATTSTAITIGQPGVSGTSGWGAPWVTYGGTSSSDVSPGIDPNLTYSSDGRIGTMVIATGLTSFGWIQRDATAAEGAFDIAFSWLTSRTGSTAFFFDRRSAGAGVTRSDMFRAGVVFEGNSVDLTVPSSTNSRTTKVFNLVYGSYDYEPAWGKTRTNTRVRLSGGGMQVKCWFANEAEPDAWTYEYLVPINPWPTTGWVFGIQPNWGATLYGAIAGNYLQVGPLMGASATADAVFQLTGDVNTITTGVLTLTSVSTAPWGFGHSWYFGQAPSGYSWAHVFHESSENSYVVGQSQLPSYSGSMASPEFTPDGYPTWPESVGMQSGGINLPTYHYENGGVEIPIKVTVRGEISAAIQSSGILGPGGPFPGSLTAQPVTINVKGFQKGPSGDGLPADYANGVYGINVTSIQVEARWPSATDWHPFELVFTLEAGRGINQNPDGSRFLSWGLEIPNILEEMSAIGPYHGNFTPSGMGLSTALRNVTYEVSLDPSFSYLVQVDPCNPHAWIDTLLAGSGATGGSATAITMTHYTTPDPYIPNTLQVWKNGYALRWGIDFTEDDPPLGLFILTSPALSTDSITTRYNTELT